MISRSFLGLAAASMMPLLGPRPLFVRTAYAQQPAMTEQVAVDAINAAAACELAPETFDAGEHLRIDLVMDDASD